MTDDDSNTENHIPPRLAAALDQLAEGVVIADARGEVVFYNRAAAAMHSADPFDSQPGELARRAQFKTMEGGLISEHELPLKRAARESESVEDVYWKIERDDGKTVVVCGTANPVLDGAGGRAGAVLTLRDETKRESERAALERAIASKHLLLREIHHRVKNNLQLVSSLLSLQSRKTTDASASSALKDLSSRVDIIADIHRALYETSETDTIEVVAYLTRLTNEHIRQLTDAFGVEFEVDLRGRFILPIEKATSLALGLNELVLNSLRHAFASTAQPKIVLRCTLGSENLTFVYRDNGAGLRTDDILQAAGGVGFGRVLIEGLERQLSARIDYLEDTTGFGVLIEIPLEGNLVAAA